MFFHAILILSDILFYKSTTFSFLLLHFVFALLYLHCVYMFGTPLKGWFEFLTFSQKRGGIQIFPIKGECLVK